VWSTETESYMLIDFSHSMQDRAPTMFVHLILSPFSSLGPEHPRRAGRCVSVSLS
jgi:hypothetical protein